MDRVHPDFAAHGASVRSLGVLVGIAATTFLAGTPATAATAANQDLELDEVVVTATHREEDIQRVPMTITAYTQAGMDDLGVRSMDDIARLTPGVQFTHTSGVAGNNSSDLSIRGVFSDVGAATTGIYIDDTPIQMRNAGYWNANAFPQVFDLERVEVLRGPQGTLFGAGSEGGAIRFITPEPGLEKDTGYLRSDVADTVGGAPSYEVGAAVGGPIIEDELGFRLSVWGREDGGYIDRVSPANGHLLDKNANATRSDAGKAALTLAPVDDLRITASLYYQDIDSDDRNQYWNSLSSGNDFAQASRVSQPSEDDFYLPSLKFTYQTDTLSFFFNSSYFYHREYAALDYTTYFGGIDDGNPLQYAAGDQPSQAFLTNRQEGITQEFRLQSPAKNAHIDWTAGIYYSRLTQKDYNLTTDGQLVYTGVYGRAPSFVETTVSTDKEVAGYGDLDFNLTRRLKLTAGVRVSKTLVDYTQTGIFNPYPLSPVSGSANSTPVTPKFGVSYQFDPDDFIYVSAAKGFRSGGVNPTLPDLCRNEPVPESVAYQPDSLWSYEIGGKNTWLDGRVQLDSSLYEIKWTNIQQSVRYANCGFSFVGNLGSATGYGGDMSARLKISHDVLVGFSASYTDIAHDQTILEGASAILAKEGDKIGGPPFNLSAFGRYSFDVSGKNAFYRIDYTYHNKTPVVDPAIVGYDPTLPNLGSNQYLSMRVGVYLGGWELSMYGNNLTEERAPLAISHDIPGGEPYYLSTYRPMTFGVTAAYRY